MEVTSTNLGMRPCSSPFFAASSMRLMFPSESRGGPPGSRRRWTRRRRTPPPCRTPSGHPEVERVALGEERAHLLDLGAVVVLALEDGHPRARVLELADDVHAHAGPAATSTEMLSGSRSARAPRAGGGADSLGGGAESLGATRDLNERREAEAASGGERGGRQGIPRDGTGSRTARDRDDSVGRMHPTRPSNRRRRNARARRGEDWTGSSSRVAGRRTGHADGEGGHGGGWCVVGGCARFDVLARNRRRRWSERRAVIGQRAIGEKQTLVLESIRADLRTEDFRYRDQVGKRIQTPNRRHQQCARRW